MSYLPSASATQWTIRNIVSTRTIQCWVGTMRESFVEAWTPHCRSSQMRTSTTCFSGLSQTVTTATTMCGLMLTLSMSITLLSGIGLTDNLRASRFDNSQLFSTLVMHYHQLVNLKCWIDGFILVSTEHCLLLLLLLCAVLELAYPYPYSSQYSSACIARYYERGYTYVAHWTRKRSYICQYHSKSLTRCYEGRSKSSATRYEAKVT